MLLHLFVSASGIDFLQAHITSAIMKTSLRFFINNHNERVTKNLPNKNYYWVSRRVDFNQNRLMFRASLEAELLQCLKNTVFLKCILCTICKSTVWVCSHLPSKHLGVNWVLCKNHNTILKQLYQCVLLTQVSPVSFR